MTWVLVALLVVAVVAVAISTTRQKKLRAAEEAAALAAVRRVADEDVTRFGEELQQLHIETLTTDLNVAMRQDYQRALDSYEHAKLLLADAENPGDVSQVTRTLEDGRYAQA